MRKICALECHSFCGRSGRRRRTLYTADLQGRRTCALQWQCLSAKQNTTFLSSRPRYWNRSESMLSLQPGKEPDLLWMLLFRIADASSLVAEEATIPFVIDQTLAAIDDRAAWKRRLTELVDLKILRMSSQSSIRIRGPTFRGRVPGTQELARVSYQAATGDRMRLNCDWFVDRAQTLWRSQPGRSMLLLVHAWM